MKKYVALLSGVIAMALTACTKDEAMQIPDSPSQMVSVTAYAPSQDDDTRIAYSQDNFVLNLAWEDEESFSVIRGGENQTFSKSTAGNTFTGILPGAEGEEDYYAVYPANANVTDITAVPYDYSMQKGVFDSNKTYMYATSTDGSKFEFKLKTALLNVKFNNLPDGVKIKQVVIMTEFNTNGTMNLTDGTYTDGTNTGITVDFDEAFDPANWMAIYLPPISSDKKYLKFIVIADNNLAYIGEFMSKSTDASKNIIAGRYYSCTVDNFSEMKSLVFVANGEQTLKMTNLTTDVVKSAVENLEYSIDAGSTWNTLGENTVNFGIGAPLLIRSKVAANGSQSYGTKVANIKFGNSNVNVVCAGDIRTLLNNTYPESVGMDLVKFQGLFKNCTSLTSAPVLPATTLTENCYSQMFYGCTSLETAPALPATTLAKGCYSQMFYNCKSLKTAPELSATTLAENCYNQMFYQCTSLETAPALPATTLVNGCYGGMFSNCSKLNSIVMLATDISATNCLDNWVRNVASTGTFVKAASMTSLPSGEDGIPLGWTVIN
ncbi:MAG: fimbrillin family protein [Alistipes sp.]|nr:fimbrillin family protein [Alistipes sp.]